MTNEEMVEEVAGDAGLAALELEAGLRERLKIEPLALEEEFLRCPADIAYIAALHGRAIEELNRAKVYARKIKGLVYNAHRQQMLDASLKPTEGQIEARLDQDERWIQAQLEEGAAENVAATARGNLNAIMAKKDMLVQMGATQRAEMEREPMIRDRTRFARDNG